MYSTLRAAKLLTVTSFLVMSAVNAQQPNFVPGQVLTRFSEGTPQRDVVVQVSQTAPLDLSGLDNVIEGLSQRLGVPLRVHHLGSGYWLTLDVDRDLLAVRIQAVLRSQEDVAGVTVTKPGGPASLLQFAISADENSRLARSIGRRSRRGLSGVMEAWSSAAGLALQYTFEDAHLAISIDWDTATVALVEQLKSMPEVEAAQLNYRMGLDSAP